MVKTLQKSFAGNYTPGSISFMDGLCNPGEGRRKDFMMRLDFDKAKEIIKRLKKEGRKIKDAEAGLDGDWSCNSQYIYDGKKYTDYDLHSSSDWATPILLVTFYGGENEAYEIWSK